MKRNRGFPFDEDEGSGAWSELASRHPDIAARLRQRPATWARKRRPSSQDATDDFGDSFGGFDRFPFDDIPPEFREHFPSHWNRRFGPRDEQPQPQQTQQHAPQSPSAQQQTAATQTEQEPQAGPSEPEPQAHLPQYGLRNTVDLGQKSPADPSLVDADDRNQRSMSAPPDSSAPPNQSFKMSGQNHQEQHQPQHGEQHSNVRHIPIFVEGRDEPVINKSVDHGTHFGDTKPAYVPPPQQPHIDREQYFADDSPGYHHPPNFTRAFGTPFNKGFRQGPQPFTQQKAYPQAAFARGASPQRSQSPKPHPHPHAEEHFVKVPVHHDQSAPKTEPPSRPQQRQQPQQQPPPQQKQPPPPQQAPQREQTPPQPKQTPANDPISQILRIQTDVLNLMTEVENFGGTKNDKKYLFLDEMLTRNLIKLDTIETDGKENIRQARKEAIKCIQKCIAVLEAKAESNANVGQSQPPPQDVEMKENTDAQPAPEQVTENGEVEMKDSTKEEGQVEPKEQAEKPAEAAPAQEAKTESKPQEESTEAKVQDETAPAAPADNKDATQTEAADTRPEATPSDKVAETIEQKEEAADKSPKKGTKVVKKRNKSKDNKKDVPNDSNKQAEDSNKEEKVEDKKENLDIMQVDDKSESQVMEVDGAASQ
uniref:BAG domain-containing protein n=1 Tax=Heliothis virescens TaxID=7102 RepID=A0A2A4JSU3_HELVI